MTVDVVVYAPDPVLYGRMIVIEREGEGPDGWVLVEIDPPDWRLGGGEAIRGEEYERREERFRACELWPEAKWSGIGQDRSDAVAAAGWC